MDDKQYGITFLNDLLRYFGIIFTLSILVMSLVVMISAEYTSDLQDISTLFAFGSIGLSFGTIFQIAGVSFILSVFRMILFSENIFEKMRFLWRTFLFLFFTLVAFSVFAIIFNWIPVNDPAAWIAFVISTIICFSLSIGLTLLKLKLEGKKYDKLLANYKARREMES